MVKAILLVLFLLILTGICAGIEVRRDAEETFRQACDLYESGEFDRAAQAFESLVKKGVRSSTVYYNLGNSYFKQGKIGKAVVNYRRALLLSPRDRNVKANLDLARSIVGSTDTTNSDGLNAFLTIPLKTFSPEEIQFGLYVSAYALAFCFLGALFSGNRVRRGMLKALIICAIIGAALLALQLSAKNQLNSHTQGVIIADCPLMSGPGNAFDQIGQLRQGVEVRLSARSGLWLEIKLPTGEVGWVEEKAVELI